MRFVAKLLVFAFLPLISLVAGVFVLVIGGLDHWAWALGVFFGGLGLTAVLVITWIMKGAAKAKKVIDELAEERKQREVNISTRHHPDVDPDANI